MTANDEQMKGLCHAEQRPGRNNIHSLRPGSGRLSRRVSESGFVAGFSGERFHAKL